MAPYPSTNSHQLDSHQHTIVSHMNRNHLEVTYRKHSRKSTKKKSTPTQTNWNKIQHAFWQGPSPSRKVLANRVMGDGEKERIRVEMAAVCGNGWEWESVVPYFAHGGYFLFIRNGKLYHYPWYMRVAFPRNVSVLNYISQDNTVGMGFTLEQAWWEYMEFAPLGRASIMMIISSGDSRQYWFFSEYHGFSLWMREAWILDLLAQFIRW